MGSPFSSVAQPPSETAVLTGVGSDVHVISGGVFTTCNVTVAVVWNVPSVIGPDLVGAERRAGDGEAQDGVAQELKALVGGYAAVFVGVRTVCQSKTKRPGVNEDTETLQKLFS